MADLTIVPPATQVQGVSAGTQGTADARGSTANLTPGSVISGTIIGKDSGGNFLLKTDAGTLSLKSNTPLTYNSDVVIRIDQAGAGTTNARILSVNGQPFDEFSAPAPQEGDVITAPLTSQAQGQSPGETSVSAVVVLATTGNAQAEQTAAPQLASGINVIIRVTPQQQNTSPTGNAGQSALGGNAAASEELPQNVARLLAPQPQQNAPSTEQQTGNAGGAAPQAANANSEDIPLPANQTQAEQETPPAAPTAALYAAYTKQPAAAPEAAPQETGNASSTSPEAPANNAPQANSSAAAAPQTAAAPATASSPSVIQAQVANVVSDATTSVITLQTAAGNVILKADALPAAQALALTPGTQITLEIPQSNASSSLVLTAQPLSTPAPAAELASSWQTLLDILSVVNDASAQTANAALSRLPQLSSQFIASSTAFVTAAMAGNVRAILGDDVLDTLNQKGRNDLIQKFTNELNDLGQLMNPATTSQRPTQGWQTIFLPFVYQQEVQQARIYVKRDNGKKQKSSDGSSSGADTRFVVEVDLSELGPMQMDGLIRPKPAASTVFDLVIRSTTPFSSEAQQEITGIFNNTSELTGFKGSVSFQVTRNFPVKPLDETLEGAGRSITV